MNKDIVLLSTADWDNPFWTNKQHVACALADAGYRVLYIESLGLRRLSATSHDISRLWRRLKRGLQPPRQVRPNIWVWAPLIAPLQQYVFARVGNRMIFNALLRLWMWRLGLGRELLWTYYPLTVDYINTDSFKATVYHCVDEIKAQPGMPVRQIEAAETKLVERADVVFVTAQTLLESRQKLNPHTYYFSNVADFDHFHAALSDLPVPQDIGAIPRPRLGFVGAISSYKLDLGLIRQVALMRPDWSLVLIGKVGEGEPWTDISTIEGVPNIHFLGPKSYGELPAYLAQIDVAMLPSALNDYTAGMFPMKFFEYLAAGRPVVATRLPALSEYAAMAALVDDAEEFVRAAELAMAGGGPPLSQRLEAAREQTYERRTARMLNQLRDVLAGRQSSHRANRVSKR